MNITLCLIGAYAGTLPAPLPSGYPIETVGLQEVRLRDSFWTPRIERNQKVSLWHALEQCEKTGRISNFEAAAGVPGKAYEGYAFNDSDVYKVLEGIAYSLVLQKDTKLEKEADRIIGLIAAAQEPDGYLQTALTSAVRGQKSPMGKERWKEEEWAHELYNVGHLYEGAAAYYEATGKRKLLDVALKNADLVCATFNKDGLKTVPGHQQIEMGLVRLYRVTGNRKYLDQARWFLDQRGKPEGRSHLYGEYSQDHKPVTEQERAVGHSVRAAYMYCGMADVSALQKLPAYDRALRNVWHDILGSKLYVTGGIGSGGSNEGFSGGFDLPNISAYAETCASIANAIWNQRMFQASGDGKYIDVMERSLYNGFLSGVGLDGKSFFYPNPLTSLNGGTRAAWFDCSCCPTNDVRILPSIPKWAYAKGKDRLYVNLYVQSDLDTKLNGQRLRLSQETQYPWDGKVKLTVRPEQAGPFGLALRVPGWASERPIPSTLYTYEGSSDEKIALSVNGKPVEAKVRDGYAVLDRSWKAGDTVEMSIPMPVRKVSPDPRVNASVGRVALQRGPLVYCAEGFDQSDRRVLNAMLPATSSFTTEFKPDLLDGVAVIDTQAVRVRRDGKGGFVLGETVPMRLVPYYGWANRGRAEMTVWLPAQPEKAYADPAPSIASQAKVTTSANWGSKELVDQFDMKTSDDHTFPYFHWWPRKDSTEWVEFAFAKPTDVAKVKAFWFHDPPHGGCRLPTSWRVLVRQNGNWVPVNNPSAYPLEADQWCEVKFDRVTTDALRIEVVQPKDFSTGIHEIVIE